MIREQIVAYIVETHSISVEEFDDTTSLFSSGILDSFTMVDLVSFIEETAGIRFGVLDLHLGNLDSIALMLRFVESKQVC